MKFIEIKTIKGYASAVRRLEKNSIACLRGFDELSREEQDILYAITGELGNLLGEFEDKIKEEKNG